MAEREKVSDEVLMWRVQRRLDAEAFRLLMERYLDRGVAVARQILRDPAAAEDAVQDALLKLILNRRRYQPRRAFSTWFYTILHNVCLDALRRHERQGRALRELAERAEAVALPPPDVTDAEALLAQLPEEMRQAVALRVGNGLSMREVAEALGISTEAAKKRVQRGLRILRDRAAGADGGPPGP